MSVCVQVCSFHSKRIKLSTKQKTYIHIVCIYKHILIVIYKHIKHIICRFSWKVNIVHNTKTQYKLSIVSTSVSQIFFCHQKKTLLSIYPDALSPLRKNIQ